MISGETTLPATRRGRPRDPRNWTEAECVVCGKSLGARRIQKGRNVTGYYCTEHQHCWRNGNGAFGPVVPCEVCGEFTRSKFRVCRRTNACRAEIRRREFAADPEGSRKIDRRHREKRRLSREKRRAAEELRRTLAGTSVRPAAPHAEFCCACGVPLLRKRRAKSYYCKEHRGFAGGLGSNRFRKCVVCGGLTTSSVGACTRSKACLRELNRRLRGSPTKYACDVCRRPTYSNYGVCAGIGATADCRTEYNRRLYRKDVRHARTV